MEYTCTAEEKRAASKILKWYMARRRLRPQNSTCAITLKPLTELASVFIKVTEAGYVRGYDKESLLRYFVASPQTPIKWPVSREPVSSVELRRLEKGTNRCDQLSTKLSKVWCHVFLLTLMNSLEHLYREIQSDIKTVEGRIEEEEEEVVDGEQERLSSFLASMLYLYVTNKTKFRSLKNRMRRSACDGTNSAVFQEICEMLDEMVNVFQRHELLLAWKGKTIVPILLDFESSVSSRLL